MVFPALFFCLGAVCFFFFNDPATTEIYTLSLHDALPISAPRSSCPTPGAPPIPRTGWSCAAGSASRSEEHTSELQSLRHLVCRLLLEKKKNIKLLHVVRGSTIIAKMK